MAIIHVTKLQDLRKRLDSYRWQVPNILDTLEFSYYSGNSQSYKKLDVEETKLLAAVLWPIGSRDYGYNFSQSAGAVLKTIAIQRLDAAIKQAAREARNEAQSVLDALEAE